MIDAVWEKVVFEDDGWVLEDGVKVLRLFAGSGVTIPYESYSNTSQSNGLTVEIDLKSKNISDEDSPMLRMGKEVDGHFVGLLLYPKRGYFFKSTNNVEWFQDIEWGEDRRTHIALNIIPGLTVGGRSINLVRMTVNANINRSFTYQLSDRFWDGVSSGGIRIGCDGADVCVYGMRIFKEKALSSSDIFNDSVAAVSDVAEKLALIEAEKTVDRCGSRIDFCAGNRPLDPAIGYTLSPGSHDLRGCLSPDAGGNRRHRFQPGGSCDRVTAADGYGQGAVASL